MSFASGQQGGKYYHKLTVNEMPSHNHINLTIAGNTVKWGDNKSSNGATSGVSATGTMDMYSGNSGGNGSHNNIQPYIATYFWKRTA